MMTSKRPTDNTDKPSNLSRRRLLQGVAIGGSSLILGKAIAGQSTQQPSVQTAENEAASKIPF